MAVKKESMHKGPLLFLVSLVALAGIVALLGIPNNVTHVGQASTRTFECIDTDFEDLFVKETLFVRRLHSRTEYPLDDTCLDESGNKAHEGITLAQHDCTRTVAEGVVDLLKNVLVRRTTECTCYDGACVPENRPPQIVIDSPSEGEEVSGMVQIQASASDDHAVTRVEFYAGKPGAQSSLRKTDTESPYVWNWNSESQPPGTAYTFEVIAYDAQEETARDEVTIHTAGEPLPSDHETVQSYTFTNWFDPQNVDEDVVRFAVQRYEYINAFGTNTISTIKDMKQQENSDTTIVKYTMGGGTFPTNGFRNTFCPGYTWNNGESVFQRDAQGELIHVDDNSDGLQPTNLDDFCAGASAPAGSSPKENWYVVDFQDPAKVAAWTDIQADYLEPFINAGADAVHLDRTHMKPSVLISADFPGYDPVAYRQGLIDYLVGLQQRFPNTKFYPNGFTRWEQDGFKGIVLLEESGVPGIFFDNFIFSHGTVQPKSTFDSWISGADEIANDLNREGMLRVDMGSTITPSERLTTLAVYLIVAGEKTSYEINARGGDVPVDYPEQLFTFGKPVERYQNIDDGLLVRAYDDGIVIVNIRDSNKPDPLRTYSFGCSNCYEKLVLNGGGDFLGPDAPNGFLSWELIPGSEYTLQPKEGLIIRPRES